MGWSYEDIELGDEVKDTISGYKGVVVAFTTWLNKCRRITVQSRKLESGKPVENQTFDIEMLELVKKGKQPQKPYTGGGRPNVGARPAGPTR
jgi:hypothetical protein